MTDPGALHINLKGTLAKPDEEFDGPLNVLIGLQGTAAAANQVEETKRIYDQNNPPDPVRVARPAPAPIGAPISAGRPIVPDASKYVIDVAIKDRIATRRNRRPPG